MILADCEGDPELSPGFFIWLSIPLPLLPENRGEGGKGISPSEGEGGFLPEEGPSYLLEVSFFTSS
jgi:hypothetical protein